MKHALVGLLVVAIAGPVAADPVDDEVSSRELVVNQVQRVRRGFVLGPHVGGYGGVGLADGGSAVHGVTVGVSVQRYAVPNVLDLRERVKAIAQRRLRERVQEIVASGGVAPSDPSELAREIVAEVIAELRGAPPRRTLEPPRWGLGLEAAISTAGGGVEVRLAVDRGFGPVAVGLTIGALRASGRTDAVAGLEVALRLTPLGRAWTPVVAPYLRGETILGSELPVTLGAGLRLVVDLF